MQLSSVKVLAESSFLLDRQRYCQGAENTTLVSDVQANQAYQETLKSV